MNGSIFREFFRKNPFPKTSGSFVSHNHFKRLIHHHPTATMLYIIKQLFLSHLKLTSIDQVPIGTTTNPDNNSQSNRKSCCTNLCLLPPIFHQSKSSIFTTCLVLICCLITVLVPGKFWQFFFRI